MSNRIQKIEQEYGCKFRPASAEELAELNENNFPALIIKHFSEFALDESTDHQIVFPDVERAIAENLHAIPGCVCSPYGIYVVASTDDGDAFCMDTNRLNDEGEPRIVSVSHEVIHEEASREEVLSGTGHVADSFSEFLDLVLTGNLPENF